MQVPLLGAVAKDESLGWYRSEPMPIAVLGGRTCRIILEGYDDDPDKEEFHAAIANFLSASPDVLKVAEPHLFRYYQDIRRRWGPPGDDSGGEPLVSIESPHDVWAHVQLGDEPVVTRRPYGDRGVYVSLECGCEWEEEHGLQIVFKNGLRVNKVGPYDGHLTHSDAFDDDRLEDVVYPPP